MCDGIADCSNGEDEHDDCLKCAKEICVCKVGCGEIPHQYLCDGSKDCSDGCDERVCLFSRGIRLRLRVLRSLP